MRDVEVTRRLYRSGESEYLIDGEVCRLRDVHDLLMDTGLGAKAYAIIEQGKIGLILSARPTDRRQLIEEAAGVTKYKSAAPRGGAEARGGAAEPDAHRRHRLRGREAARHAEAAGGEGAALPAAARRAAPLGEGAVRAQVPRSSARRSSRRAAGWPTRASARRPRRRAWPKSKPTSSGCGSSWSRPTRATTAAREAAHARELDDQPAAAADRVRPRAGRGARRRAAAARGRARARSKRAASRRASSSKRAATRRRARPAERDRAAAALRGEDRRVRRRRSATSKGSRPTSKRRAAKCSRAVNSATALRHALEHAAAARDRVGEQLAQARRRARRSATSKRSARRSDRAARRGGLRRAQRGDRGDCASTAPARNRSWRGARRARWRVARAARARARARRRQRPPEVARGARRRARRIRRRARGCCWRSPADAVSQQGAVADYLEVDGRLRARGRGVPRRSAAARRRRAAASRPRPAWRFARAARCRALSGSWSPAARRCRAGVVSAMPDRHRRFADVVARQRPARRTRSARRSPTPGLPAAIDAARRRPRRRTAPIATLDGEVFRGAHLVEGGARAEARGILRPSARSRSCASAPRPDARCVGPARATRPRRSTSPSPQLRIRDRGAAGRTAPAGEGDRRLRRQVPCAPRSRRAHHAASSEQLATERRTGRRRARALEARQDEARESIARIEAEQRTADERLTAAQRRLFEAREAMQAQAAAPPKRSRRTRRSSSAPARWRPKCTRLEEVGARARSARHDAPATSSSGRRAALDQLVTTIAAAKRSSTPDCARSTSSAIASGPPTKRRGAARGVRRARGPHPRGARGRSNAFAPKPRSSTSHAPPPKPTSRTWRTTCVDAVQATLDEVAAEVAELEKRRAARRARGRSTTRRMPAESRGRAGAGDRRCRRAAERRRRHAR